MFGYHLSVLTACAPAFFQAKQLLHYFGEICRMGEVADSQLADLEGNIKTFTTPQLPCV